MLIILIKIIIVITIIVIIVIIIIIIIIINLLLLLQARLEILKQGLLFPLFQEIDVTTVILVCTCTKKPRHFCVILMLITELQG